MDIQVTYSITVTRISFFFTKNNFGLQSGSHIFCVFSIHLCHVSGNTDAVVPVTSTRYTINALKLPTVSPWRAWYDDGEVSQ